MENIDDLTEHIKKLIKDCDKREDKKVAKHIESLKELLKYKEMETKTAQCKIIENGESINITANGKSVNLHTNAKDIYINGNKVFPKEDESEALKKIEELDCPQPIEHLLRTFVIYSAVAMGGILVLVAVLLLSVGFKEIDMLEKIDTYIYGFVILFIVLYFIYAFCFFWAYRYEYRAYMKGKELSNELIKIFYQGKINKILKQ